MTYLVRQGGGLGETDFRKTVQEFLQPLARQAVPATMDVLIPEALDYLDKNRYQVWQRAKPVLEHIGEDERIREEARPVVRRLLNKARKQYGQDTYYPKYGKYATPAIGLGAGLIVGSFGAGALTLKSLEKEGSKKATAMLGVTYLLGLGGLGLAIAGVALTGGNWLFPKE